MEGGIQRVVALDVGEGVTVDSHLCGNIGAVVGERQQ